MKEQVYHYWVEIEGKMKGKRKVTKQQQHVSYCALDTGATLESLVKVSHYVDQLVALHKPQKNTVWRLMRTIVSEHTYDNGTVMHFVDLFDVNRKVIAQGDVK